MISAEFSFVAVRWAAGCGFFLVLAGSVAAQGPAPAPSPAASSSSSPSSSASVPSPVQPLPLTVDELLGYLHRLLDWYHHVNQVAQLPGAVDDPVIRDRLQSQALTELRLGFELGRAAAPLVSQGGAKAAASSGQASVVNQLLQAANSLRARDATLSAQIAALEAQIKRVRGRARQSLRVRRDSLAASLGLVHEGQASVQQMLEFANRAVAAGGEAQGALAGQIDELARSVPQLQRQTPGGTAAPAAVPSSAFRVESAGIIALLSQAFSLRDTQSQMASLGRETDALLAELSRLRANVGSQARQIMQGSIAATQETGQQALAQRQAIEAGIARFKALSAVVVPLSEQVFLLTNARTTIEEWRHSVDVRMLSVMRYFALRLAVLLLSVIAVLVASDLWRRATLRYVRDPNRRRPLLVLRRLAVGMALVLVIAFGLASEVGSLATFMGFLTAGIAVTLQNVILSVVAYFFLIGRYGVQVGDRITLAGVTGRVVDVSLLRLYVLELAGTDLHSTGRIVVISNSVLFQPQALYKQIPGADYLWHTLTLTIAAGADIGAVWARMEAAADGVFRQYASALERQYSAMQQHVDFETGLPRLQVRVEVAEEGLRCSVRYPVPPDQAAMIDQQMLEALRKALEEDGKMKLLSTGAVKLTWDA